MLCHEATPSSTAGEVEHHLQNPTPTRHLLQDAAGKAPTQPYAMYTRRSGVPPPSRRRSGRQREREPPNRRRRGGRPGGFQKSSPFTVAGRDLGSGDLARSFYFWGLMMRYTSSVLFWSIIICIFYQFGLLRTNLIVSFKDISFLSRPVSFQDLRSSNVDINQLANLLRGRDLRGTCLDHQVSIQPIDTNSKRDNRYTEHIHYLEKNKTTYTGSIQQQ